MLIVDDVYSTGRNVNAVLERLRRTLKRNLPRELRVAAPYYRPPGDDSAAKPDYYLQKSEDWLVLPYELTGLTRDEIRAHKPWILPLLDELKPGWQSA